MDIDGDKHRLKLLGTKEFIDSKRNEFRCEECQSVFLTKHALAVHMNGKWCRDKNDMSEHQLRRLRGFRQVSEKRIGMNRLDWLLNHHHLRHQRQTTSGSRRIQISWE